MLWPQRGLNRGLCWFYARLYTHQWRRRRSKTNMTGKVSFRLKLKVRVGKTFETDDSILNASFGGKKITIRTDKQDVPFAESDWLVFEARGFATESNAEEFGKRLRDAVHISALCCRLGADGGRDETLGSFNENIDHSKGGIKSHQRISPDVHGISIFPDDGNNVSMKLGAEKLRVMSYPDQFLDGIKQVSKTRIEQKVMRAIKVLNLALVAEDDLATIVLSFAAVEALCSGPSWSEGQLRIIEELARQVEEHDPTNKCRMEISAAIRGLHNESLRQSVRRKLCSYGIKHLFKEWDAIYKRRSRLYHGGEELERQELSRLSGDAFGLCGKIVLMIASKGDGKLPETARTHFDI